MEQRLTQLKQRSRTANGNTAVPFSTLEGKFPSPVESLQNFTLKLIRIAHIYQPMMIKELLRSGGRATIRNIAAAFLSRDASQLEYYEQITKDMPGKVLGKYGIVVRDGSEYLL